MQEWHISGLEFHLTGNCIVRPIVHPKNESEQENPTPLIPYEENPRVTNGLDS